MACRVGFLTCYKGTHLGDVQQTPGGVNLVLPREGGKFLGDEGAGWVMRDAGRRERARGPPTGYTQSQSRNQKGMLEKGQRNQERALLWR